jgi:hypothetical protein
MEHGDVRELEEIVQSRLAGRVYELRLLLREDGLVLQGCCRSQHVKQLAQHFVLEESQAPLVSNQIIIVKEQHNACRRTQDPHE